MGLMDRIAALGIHVEAPARAPEPVREPAPIHEAHPAPPSIASRVLAVTVNYERGNNPTGFAESDRIVALPESEPITPEEVDAISREELLRSFYDGGGRLFKQQAWAVRDWKRHRKLFGKIAVGWGKSLLSVLIARLEIRSGHAQRPILFIPASVYTQFFGKSLFDIRRMISVPFEIIGLGNMSSAQRRSVVLHQRRGLYVMPYSTLQGADASELLGVIKPDLYIADEAHYLARDSARSKRFYKCLAEFPAPVAPMSGTITSKSIRDYSKLFVASHGDMAPVPHTTNMVIDWAQVLDSDAVSIPDTARTGPLLPILKWARDRKVADPSELQENVAGFREAFKHRVNRTPGVVTSGDSEIGNGLWIVNEEVPFPETTESGVKLKNLINNVAEIGITPDGDEIDHQIHTYKWLYELSAGFYNSLYWPEPAVVAKRRGVSLEKAAKDIEDSKAYHAKAQVLAKHMRTWFGAHHVPGADTPMTLGKHFSLYGTRNLPRAEDVYEAWLDAKTSNFEARVERDHRVVRVCPWKIDAMIAWAKSRRRGLVWVHNEALGLWAYEALVAAGLPAMYCPAGDVKILDEKIAGDRVVVASIGSHGTGKELQFHHENYMLQWPRPARTAEQLIGRTHRNHQKADDVFVYTNMSFEWDKQLFAATLNDAAYIQTTTDVRQKLFVATYDPAPKIYSFEVLKLCGFEPSHELNPKSKQLLKDKFFLE